MPDAPLRRIKLTATGEVYTVVPSFVLPYRMSYADAVEKALFLRRFGVPFWGDTETLTILDAPIAWSPSGDTLLLTMRDVNGATGIYALDMRRAPDVDEPQLLIADGRAPAYAPNGRYVAFEREIDGLPSIVVAMVDRGAETVIETGMACESPIFGDNSIDLYFTCLEENQSKLIHYGINGSTTLPIPLDNVFNPSPGPGTGYLAVDDGTMAYYVNQDGSDIGQQVGTDRVSRPSKSRPGEDAETTCIPFIFGVLLSH